MQIKKQLSIYKDPQEITFSSGIYSLFYLTSNILLLFSELIVFNDFVLVYLLYYYVFYNHQKFLKRKY